ncbi:hypothetical protein C4D60_Mb04t12930 [Musa balbisiana]|uniref:Uncharacterized protein n=1 Tax=Musa balbisiana TaxID=52838 RepID=A0A4S8KBN4_MUSBA|nr:hypothetical protein C4D60_Mb04t12930 [Musa balbisiana]
MGPPRSGLTVSAVASRWGGFPGMLGCTGWITPLPLKQGHTGDDPIERVCPNHDGPEGRHSPTRSSSSASVCLGGRGVNTCRSPGLPSSYVCRSEGWSFGIRWAARMIDNIAPVLNDEERNDLRRLKEILPTSRAIGQMTEGWLVEAGLSPTPRDMVNLAAVRGGRASSVTAPRPPAEPGFGTREAPLELEAGRPRKKAKACASKKLDVQMTQPEGRVSREAGRGRRRDLGCSEAGPSREVAVKAPREPSIRDLCRLPVGTPGEPYQARAVGELPEGQPSDPLGTRWGGLTQGDWVWVDGESVALFARGGLHPDLAREIYVMPSDVLLGKAAKSLLWGHHYATALMDRARDAGRTLGVLVDRNIKLRKQIEEVRAGAGPEAVTAAEQRASDLEAEATKLRSAIKVAEQHALDLEAETARLQAEVKAAGEQNKELQPLVRVARTETRLEKKEAASLQQKLEEALAEAKRASEALAAEADQRPEKDKKLIEDYKSSSGFRLGLI